MPVHASELVAGCHVFTTSDSQRLSASNLSGISQLPVCHLLLSIFKILGIDTLSAITAYFVHSIFTTQCTSSSMSTISFQTLLLSWWWVILPGAGFWLIVLLIFNGRPTGDRLTEQPAFNVCRWKTRDVDQFCSWLLLSTHFLHITTQYIYGFTTISTFALFDICRWNTRAPAQEFCLQIGNLSMLRTK